MYRLQRKVATKPAVAMSAARIAPTLASSAASTSDMPAMKHPTARDTAPAIGRLASR